MKPLAIEQNHHEQQAEAAKLDAATCLRRAFGRQVAANLKELGYGW